MSSLSTERNHEERTRKVKVRSDLQEEVVYQLEGSRLLVLLVLVRVLVLVLVVVSSDSAEHGAFEAWEANAASAEDEAERSARAESPVRRTKRTASGRTLR